MKPIYIEATTLEDFWFQCVYEILDKGRRYVIEQGSFVGETRIEFDFITGLIKQPYSDNWQSMLPQMPQHLNIPDPCTLSYLYQYVPYLMSSDIVPEEQYTYGSRLGAQVPTVINLLKKTPNTNQAVLRITQPSDYKLTDPPCLLVLDLRVMERKLHIFPYFRSWDLWSGTPANLAAIAILQKFMADEIGIEVGSLICTSKGLHLYKYCEELALLRTNKERVLSHETSMSGVSKC
jgi:thymidylate synthase